MHVQRDDWYVVLLQKSLGQKQYISDNLQDALKLDSSHSDSHCQKGKLFEDKFQQALTISQMVEYATKAEGSES